MGQKKVVRVLSKADMAMLVLGLTIGNVIGALIVGDFISQMLRLELAQIIALCAAWFVGTKAEEIYRGSNEEQD